MSITVVDVRTYRPISGIDDVTEALVLERRHDRAGYVPSWSRSPPADYGANLAPTLHATSLVECYQLIQETRA